MAQVPQRDKSLSYYPGDCVKTCMPQPSVSEHLRVLREAGFVVRKAQRSLLFLVGPNIQDKPMGLIGIKGQRI